MIKINPKIGVTEQGDPSLDFSWVKKLLLINIIITKNLSDEMISHLLQNKNRIILHITCTGLGNSKLEPNIPDIKYTYLQIKKLIRKGFPSKQIVLRIDPIVPTQEMLKYVESVLKLFKNTGIKRVRYSYIDMYSYVKNRLFWNGIRLSYDYFWPPHMKYFTLQLLEKYSNKYEFESCSEIDKYTLGCISKKDFEILGIPTHVNSMDSQRKNCLCLLGKTELLSDNYRCNYKCLYCYLKDKPKEEEK